MPAPSNLFKKPTRASYARMLAHITIGLGISTGAALVADPAHGQSCDRCAGLKSPTCGCEFENRPGPKHANCKCVPKPSLGEQLLSHFDKVGDRIEAKAKNRCNGLCDQATRSRYDLCPTCGCESPPAWAPDSKPPQKTNLITPAESKLPDVLVDPFKDDASFRGTRQKMERILLTSDRQILTKDPRNATSDRRAEKESIPFMSEKPSRLSPIKLSGPNLQFEATESASSNGSQVVPSNFFEESMGKVILRKETPKRYSDEMPLVPRMRVPTKR